MNVNQNAGTLDMSVNSRICFCLDENTDQRIVEVLRKHGISVTTAQEMGLVGDKDDAKYLARATEQGCVLVTGDQDLGAINRQWLEEGKHHTGIVFISSTRPRSPGELARRLIEIYETRTPEDMADLFWPI